MAHVDGGSLQSNVSFTPDALHCICIAVLPGAARHSMWCGRVLECRLAWFVRGHLAWRWVCISSNKSVQLFQPFRQRRNRVAVWHFSFTIYLALV